MFIDLRDRKLALIWGSRHMHRNKLALIAVAILVLTACTTSKPKDTPATTVDKLVSTDVEATWNVLIAGIRGRDFTINSLAKEERTIRVLVQSANPSQYVDCGEISVRSRHPEFGNRDYNFPAANSARYLVADERADELVDVERRTSLNALANIRLTPHGQGTLVRVDASYVMNFRTREFGNNVPTRSLDDSLKFVSFQRASMDEQIREGATTKTVTVECEPTGELERRIVAALGKTAG